MSNQDLPLVSIITPSYNQGRFIRETIQSVLQQDYPNLEHIVIDGGSTDETLSILHHFHQKDKRLSYVSERDRGQSHAINKGLSVARGEIIGWLNSDDTYQPGAIRKAVQALLQHPEWGMVHGIGHTTNEANQPISVFPYPPKLPVTRQDLFECCYICQPTAFIRKAVFQEVQGVDESLQFCMDYDLWIRISKNHQIGTISDFLANARYHTSSKSMRQWVTVGIPEVFQTNLKHFGTVSHTWLLDHYLPNYRPAGALALLQDFKKYGILGQTPQVTAMNRYSDLWVPIRFVLIVESQPIAPMKVLLINGRALQAGTISDQNRYCTVMVNGNVAGTIPVNKEQFTLEITLPGSGGRDQVEIYSSWNFLAPDLQHQQNKRVLSFQAHDVLALSETEWEFYRLFQTNASQIREWLREKRRINPKL